MSIIHDLRLLPKEQWTHFKDAGKHAHVSKYGGYAVLQLDHPPGTFKRIPMRYTPSLPITVVNFTKFRDPLKCIESEFTSFLHSMNRFLRVWKYSDGSFEVCSLFKLQVLRPSIERYYTNEFIKVSSDVLAKYNRGEFSSKTDFKHVFSVESLLNSCYTNDESTPMLHDPSGILRVARSQSPSVVNPSASPSVADDATVSIQESSKQRSPSVSFAPGTKAPAASPPGSPTTVTTASTSDSDSSDVMDVLDKTGRLIEKDLANVTPSAVHVLKPPVSRHNHEVTVRLWHHRLCHMGNSVLHNLWKYVDGVPKISRPSPLLSCSSCMSAKIRKNGKPVSEFHLIEDIRNDPNGRFFQHLFADRGFIVQKSKNMERYKRLCAYNGDNNYLCIECVWAEYVFIFTSDNKEMPLLWLEYLLSKYAPRDVKEKTFRMDGEGDNDDLIKLFQSRGYRNESTGGNNSSANPLPEKFNDTLKTNIVATIKGVEWSMKVWNHAAVQLVRINNSLPKKSGIVPYTRATGRRPNLKYLRLFGCPIEALKPGTKLPLDDKSRFGRFIGYDTSMKLFRYIQKGSSKVLTTPHAKFDELFNSVDYCPPVARDLRRALGMESPSLPDDRRKISCDVDFDVVTSDKFARVFSVTFSPQRDMAHGFSFDVDTSNMDRPFVADVAPNSLGRTHKTWRKDFIGAYVTRVNDVILYKISDIVSALESCLESDDDFSMTFSQDINDPLPKSDLSKALTRLDLDQTRYIRSILNALEAGEDEDPVHVAQVSVLADSSGLASVDDLDGIDIQELPMTVELCEYDGNELDASPIDSSGAFLAVNNISKGSMFSRKQLQQRDDFQDWKDAEFQQLDDMEECKMFGNIVTRASLAEKIKSKSVDVIRPVWSYRVKLHTSRKKARFCGGGQHIKPKSKQEYKTYTACATAAGVRVVVAISALENRLLFSADAINAYAQSGPLSKPCFLVVDEVVRDWYLERHKISLQLGMLIEVLSSIQGHYEAGPNWQRKANAAMEAINFKSCPHDPSIYSHKNKDLAVRQIDDFLCSMKTDDEFKKFLEKLKEHINVEREGDLATDYNGFEIHQFREYIGLGVAKYIGKLCETMGWEERPGEKNKSNAPLSGEILKEIDATGKGPVGTSDEGLSIRKEFGFNYRFLLGALVYCGVIVRVDIAYSLGLLSRFAEYPARVHYVGLKSVLRYLRDTKDWMLIYWRKEPLDTLPSGPFQAIDEPDDCEYMYPSDPFLVSADVDSSHANCKMTHRSTGGHNIMLAATTVLWSSKLQQLVSLSSTEAEFYQAVTCCKAIIWLRHIMNEIGRPQLAPSPVNEDNNAAIMMINQKRPTSRTRHMEYQWYAIQDWKEQGLIQCHYIPTKENSSDNLTKGLTRILHHRHARRAMGHFGSPYSSLFPNLKIRPDSTKQEE